MGETERQIRLVFQRAREKSEEGVPVIVFFDEMDSLFRTRGTGISSDMESTIVPQLLAEIDGVETLKDVIVIGASNREDLIDPAILRPGRLDVKIRIERPNEVAAAQIFSRYLTPDLPLDADEVRTLGGGDPAKATQAMIETTVAEMYRNDEENRFLEVTYQGGDKEVLYYRDFSSGAMIENIVRRAKKLAIKRAIAEEKPGDPDRRPARVDPPGVQGERGSSQHDQSGRLGEDLRQEGRADRLHPHAHQRPGGDQGWPVHRAGGHRSVSLTTGRDRVDCVAIPKVCGIETEYGIQVVHGDPNPIAASSVLINAYAHDVARQQTGWDFEDEAPGNDARGFAREGAMPPQVETHLVNTVLTNGARFYVDHAHPEFSTPECRDALECLRYDRAGELILTRAMEAADLAVHDGSRLVIYKNNSDGKGNSYGAHENYLMDRAAPFTRIVTGITPHFVTRQIFAGAGKVGSETATHDGKRVDFQLSQRAEFFEEQVGLETTLKRPIVNTRDEPHADPQRYRRLHVIVGDANLAEVATFLKVGHHLAGAGHDRGRRVRQPEPGPGRPGAGHARGGPGPDVHLGPPDGRRDHGHRPGHPVGALLAGPQVRRRPGTRVHGGRGASARRCCAAGSRCSTAWRPTRCPWPASSTGWPSSS